MSRLERMPVFCLHIFGPETRQCTVSSAPTVIGSVILRRFKLFLGQFTIIVGLKNLDSNLSKLIKTKFSHFLSELEIFFSSVFLKVWDTLSFCGTISGKNLPGSILICFAHEINYREFYCSLEGMHYGKI